MAYLMIFVPPALLVIGAYSDIDYLLPLFFFLGVPTLRLLFGSEKDGDARVWNAWQRRALEWIPRLYVPAFLGVMTWAFATLGASQLVFTQDRILFAASVLVMCGLATCVAHELAHRRTKWDRRSAMLVAAVAGYPFFVYEHLAHHLDPRNADQCNCPRRSESVWRFCARRSIEAPRQAFQASSHFQRLPSCSTWLDGQWFYVSLSVLTWVCVTARAGWQGAATYGLLVVGVPFLLNGITYIQHWGLERDDIAADTSPHQVGWDETSRVQAWLILGISFHDQHHREPARSYFEYGPTRGAPRLPADYAIMFLLCMVPPAWSAVMNRRLEAWLKTSQFEKTPAP